MKDTYPSQMDKILLVGVISYQFSLVLLLELLFYGYIEHSYIELCV